MTRTREAWARVIEEENYRISELVTLMFDWQEAEEKLEDERDKAKEEVEELTEDLKYAETAPPEWGNCRRGCPPAFLNHSGFCSPACEKGAPRGEFVTLPGELVVSDGGHAADH